jgi:hypothetical protein
LKRKDSKEKKTISRMHFLPPWRKAIHVSTPHHHLATVRSPNTLRDKPILQHQALILIITLRCMRHKLIHTNSANPARDAPNAFTDDRSYDLADFEGTFDGVEDAGDLVGFCAREDDIVGAEVGDFLEGWTLFWWWWRWGCCWGWRRCCWMND